MASGSMRQIYRYKAKHILYNTGEVQAAEEPEDAGKEAAAEEAPLTEEQMNVVLGSMSDNRIIDSVKDIVEHASETAPENALTEEQMRVVMGSMSDNRIIDSVKELVEHSGV